MKLNESEKNRIRGLHKEFSVIQEQKTLLKENIACEATPTGDDCEEGTCLWDPGTSSMCCMKIVDGNNQGCIDGKRAPGDGDWGKGPREPLDTPDKADGYWYEKWHTTSLDK